MSVNLSKERTLEVASLLHDWRSVKGKDLDSRFWEKFIEKHRDILNYTKVSRLFSNSTNKGRVKFVIDTIVNQLFDESGCDEMCEIDFSNTRGVTKFLQMATGWRVKDYPQWLLSSYKHFNWSIGLFLILLNQFTRKRGTAVKVIKDLVKGYKKYNKVG